MIVKLAPYKYAWNSLTQTWSSSGELIEDAYDVKASESLGENNDAWSFKIPNTRNGRYTDFSPQDRIEINLLLNNDIASSDNLVMNGLLKVITEDVTDNAKTLRLEGRSFGEITTNGLVFLDRSANTTSLNVMQFITAAVLSIALRNGNFGITVDAPSTKRDGSAFPAINTAGKVIEFDKSLNYILQKYLQDEYTGDGKYYWYVNSQKVLVIRPRLGSTISTALVEGESFKTARYRINADEVRNYIIVKCGLDAYNKPITSRYDDVVSRAQFGFRYYMIVDSKISSDLILSNAASTSTKFPASYPYITSWGVSTSSNDDYNDKLRLKCKSIGEARGRDFAFSHNQGYVEISVSMAPTMSIRAGDYVAVTAPSYNLTNYPMRVKSVDWDVDSTDVVLIEEVASQ